MNAAPDRVERDALRSRASPCVMKKIAPMIASGAMITLMRNDHRHE